MAHNTALVAVPDDGKLHIPAWQRKLLGIETGGMVVLQVENGELRVRPVRKVIADLQARVREHFGELGGSLVDELIAERRAEAAREEL